VTHPAAPRLICRPCAADGHVDQADCGRDPSYYQILTIDFIAIRFVTYHSLMDAKRRTTAPLEDGRRPEVGHHEAGPHPVLVRALPASGPPAP
jgi:hypothetical protein